MISQETAYAVAICYDEIAKADKLAKLDNIKASLKAVGQQYADDFCGGWKQHWMNSTLEGIKQVQESNDNYRRGTGRPELITTGLVDGWNARNDLFPKKP